MNPDLAMRYLPGCTFQGNMNMPLPAVNLVKFQISSEITFQFQMLREYDYYNNTIIVK